MSEPKYPEPHSSVELTKNAKGDRQWSIKASCPPGEEQAATERAAAVDDWLEVRYGK